MIMPEDEYSAWVYTIAWVAVQQTIPASHAALIEHQEYQRVLEDTHTIELLRQENEAQEFFFRLMRGIY